MAIFFGKPQTRRAGYRGSRSPTLLDFRPNAPTDIYDTYRFRVERLSQMCQFRLFVYLVSGLFVPLRYIGNGRIVYLPSRRAISANFRPLLLGGYRSDLKIPMGQFKKGFVPLKDTLFPSQNENSYLTMIGITFEFPNPPREDISFPHDLNSNVFFIQTCFLLPLILPFYTSVIMPSRENRHRWVYLNSNRVK